MYPSYKFTKLLISYQQYFTVCYLNIENNIKQIINNS